MTVSQRDSTGLVEQKSVDIASRFHSLPRHCQHIVLDQAIHAGNANGREQTTDGRRNEAHQQRDQYENRLRRSRVDGKGLKCHHGKQKNDGQPGKQDVERNFIGGFLPLCSFDQCNHPIEEGLTWIRSDAYFDPIRQNAGTAGYSRSIASCFSDHRC